MTDEADRRTRRPSTPCSTTRSARTATTAPSAPTSTTTTPRRRPDAEAIVASAQARGVPVISYKQLLDWTDGRNNSTIRGLSWNAGTFTFVTTVGAGANGLQTMLPTAGPDRDAERAHAAAARRRRTPCRRSRASSTRCSTRSPGPARRRTRSASTRNPADPLGRGGKPRLLRGPAAMRARECGAGWVARSGRRARGCAAVYRGGALTCVS